MPAASVRQRPHERVLISPRRQSRKQFADLNARNVRIDRRKRPAKVGPGLGLGIKCFEMAGPPTEPNENHCRSLGDRLFGRLCAKTKQSWQAQTGKAPQADFQQGTTTAPLRFSGSMRRETGLSGMESGVGRHGGTFWSQVCVARIKYDASPKLPQDALYVHAVGLF